MFGKHTLIAALACLISLGLGMIAGRIWHFPFQLIHSLNNEYSSRNTLEIATRLPDLIREYKEPVDGDPLNLHVFQPDVENENNSTSILFFHGGGWSNGTADIFYPHCTWLAARGFGCLSAEYRTSESHGTSPLHAVEDAKSAYAYASVQAQELGLNDGNLYVAGASAGGHLAAAIVTAEYPEFSISKYYPRGVVLLGPVIDNSPEGYKYEIVKYFGKRFSPLHNLDSNFPRTLFIVGENDRFVPVSTARAFVSELQALGVDATLTIYPDAYHSFYMIDQFEKTMRDIEQFLRSDLHKRTCAHNVSLVPAC